MASHAEIKVGDTDWVIRMGGADVSVKILEKIKKASGRGYEFRCKRFQNGRSVGRNIVRGSGSFRRQGQPVRSSGFAKNGGAPKAAEPKAAAPKSPPRRPRARTKPMPTPPSPYRRNPPASAFFSEVQEPGASRSPAGHAPAAGGRLGSLRGRGRSTSSPGSTAPARPKEKGTSPSAAKREIERQLKHAGLTPLATQMIKRLIACDGSDLSISRLYGDVMSEYRLNLGPFRGQFRR
jgi:hypothetical protein